MNKPQSLRNCTRIRQSIRGDCLSSTHPDSDILRFQDSETILIGSIISGEKHCGRSKASPDLLNPVTFGCFLDGTLHNPVTSSHHQVSTPGITDFMGS
jgi:hypothetical protein